MEKKRIVELRGKAQSISATVHVGKGGVDQALVDEISRQLKKTKLVKIKLLPSCERDKKEVAAELARSTSSVMIEVRGNTAVLARE